MWLFQDFGFVEWWKAIAVVTTGIFACFALTHENKDKDTGRLTKWGVVATIGIVISSVGGLLAQILDSAHAVTVARERHIEIMRILTPLRIAEVYTEFKVPCKVDAFARFCQNVRTFHKTHPVAIMPKELFDVFPGGQNTMILLSF
jgi:hypothetical protein